MAKFKYKRPRRKYRTQTRTQPQPKVSPFDDALTVAIRACGIRTPKIGSTVSTHSKQASRLGRHAFTKDQAKTMKQHDNATIHGDRTHDRLIDLISRTLTTK